MSKLKAWILIGFFFLINRFSFTQTEIPFGPISNGQTFNTCNGFIIDSGGQGGGGYSNDENTTITICPDNPDDFISIQFTQFNLDQTDDNPLPNAVNVDRMLIYDGTSTAALLLGSYSGSELFNVIVKATPQNDTRCLTLRFISNTTNAAGAWRFSASVSCNTPCADPIAGGRVLNGIANDSIHACIGQVLNFQELGSFAQTGFTLQQYRWDFMDGSSALGQNVSHAYSQPGHYRVQLFVTDDNGCNNNNLTDIDVLVATEPNFVNFMSEITTCIGETITLAATPLLYENTWSGFNGSTEIEDGCMYDTLLGVSQDVEIIQTGFQSGTFISSIDQIQSICMEIEHSFTGDLVISIICPSGQSVILHQQGGGGTFLGEANDGESINCDDPATIGVPYNYCFTPTAVDTWVDFIDNSGFIDILPEGNYASIEPLENLIGCPANGVWTLSVVDNWAADDGKVFSFALNLDPSMYADVVEFTPQHSSPSDSSYWQFPASFATYLSPDADTMFVTPTSTGTYVYPYTVVNDFGCSNDTTVTVNVFEVNLPFILEDQSVCAETPFFVSGDFQPCNYTIRLIDSFGDGWNGNSLDVTHNGVTNNYTIDDGDLLNVPILVNQNDQIVFVFYADGSFVSECEFQLIDCNGNVVFHDGADFTEPLTIPQVQTVNMQSPVPGYTYVWSPASILDNPNSSSPSAIISGNTTITLTYFPTNHPLCVVTDQLEATIIPDAYAGMDSLLSFCTNQTSIDLSQFLGPGYATTGTWRNPNGTIINMPIDLTNNLAGPYTYSVGNGTCEDIATVTNTIVYEPLLETNYVTDPDICIGDQSVFINTNNLQNLASILVRFGDTSSVLNVTANYDSIFYVYPYTGTFNFIVDMTSTNGCVYQNIYPNIVSVHDYPIADFTIYPENINILEPQAQVSSVSTGGIVSYLWTFENADKEFSFNSSENLRYAFEAGIYPVKLLIIDSVGCSDSITKMIKIEDVPLIYFPNSFTPNGDEYNQTWKIFANGIDIQNFELKIYNRWGELIFETRDPSIGWDGTFNNKIAPTGMYMWKLKATDISKNLRFEKEGHVTLLK